MNAPHQVTCANRSSHAASRCAMSAVRAGPLSAASRSSVPPDSVSWARGPDRNTQSTVPGRLSVT